MKIYLLRHGETAYNVDHRYQGVTDIPLSPAGLAALKQADFSPKTVYVTPLKRTKQTAKILFPTAEYIPVNDLSEMNFGVFEGRNYEDMEHDTAYRAWVDSNCESTCPGGECKADFSERVCKAFELLLNQSIQNSEDTLVIVAHGGTQMAVMEKYAIPHKNYYEWCAPTRRLCARCLRLARKSTFASHRDRAVHKGGHMLIFFAVLGGFILDAIFGDPLWLPHPVVYMGKVISFLDRSLRKILPKTPRGERIGGAITAFILPVGTFLLSGAVCFFFYKIHWEFGLLIQMFWCAQSLAAKGLVQESRNVYKELKKNDLPAARKAVSRIVGRDTDALSMEGVTKAAVETVAENAGDGVIAPLLCMLIGGAPLALTYKAINTMDSMLGYKNEKYINFGRVPAKLDDAANYIPSRIAALLWVLAAGFTGNSVKGAWKIWRRDRRNHASPNSAQTESACAGALGVQLAGPAYYFGEYYDKPTIGDPLRPVMPEDILKADRMMYAGSILTLVLGLLVRAAFVLL